MAITLLFDFVDGGYWENGADFSRVIRKGIVSGILTLAGTTRDPNVIARAAIAAGMPNIGDAHPSIPVVRVQRQIFRGISGDQCSVEVHYESPQFGAAGGTFFLSDETSLQSTTESVVSGSGTGLFEPIYLVYVADTAGGLKGNQYPASIQRLTPLRTLKMVQITSTRPSVSLLDCIGKVNGTPWQGKPPGYWICAEVSSSTDNASFLYTVTASFMTRQWRDWKEYAVYVSPMSGTTPANVMGADNIELVKGVIGATYSGPGQNHDANGFVGVSPYDTTDFYTVFGI